MGNEEFSVKEAFAADYYRMTGKEFKKTPYDYLQILLRHNIRYMFWWRKQTQPMWKTISKLQLFRYAKKYGIEMGAAQIGKGLYLGHAFGITVNGSAVIGNNVNLHKGVTIGMENRGKRWGAPQIGNNVYIGINATIVGNVSIGNNVMIAPNSFVNIDVPDDSIVLGNPAVIVRKENATQNYVNYCV